MDSISTTQMENLIQNKILNCLGKMKFGHLSLVVHVPLANSLILSTLWYLLTLCAGGVNFLNKIEWHIVFFVSADRIRMGRNTAIQSKTNGGLGLLSVLLSVSVHCRLYSDLDTRRRNPSAPKKLCSHLAKLSRRRWGYPDFSWVVTNGGSKESRGSLACRNICCAWSHLKPFLKHLEPHNQEEYIVFPVRLTLVLEQL